MNWTLTTTCGEAVLVCGTGEGVLVCGTGGYGVDSTDDMGNCITVNVIGV